MLRASRAIIQQFKEVEDAMTQFKGVSGGKLNVTVISAGDYFFPRLLVEFARQHSGVTLNFGVCNREQLLGQLADNLTDLAIMVRPPRGCRYAGAAVCAAPLCGGGIARPSAGREPAHSRVERLAREPFIVREKGSDTWHSMEEAFG